MVAFTSMEREHIIEAVQAMYTDVARVPEKDYHFPVGREACLALGYVAEWLDSIPATAVESFAGVACPVQGDVFREGDTVLDIGSGSGTDSLIAANRVGSKGRVYCLDMTDAMLHKLGSNIEKLGAQHVVRLRGNAEDIPLPNQSVDIITSNGDKNTVDISIGIIVKVDCMLQGHALFNDFHHDLPADILWIILIIAESILDIAVIDPVDSNRVTIHDT